jgi:adenine/guanine phosphoribosyltransferase-like PRPP-binding protein
MTIVLLIFPLLLMGTLIVGYFRFRDDIFEVARALQNKKAFTPFSALPPREVIPMIKSSTGEEFEKNYLPDAMSKLVKYANTIQPDWFVGVHPGGRILSVLLAESMGFPRDRCLYVRTSRRQTNKILFTPQRYELKRPREGTMLIFDDISRTGRTLHLLKRYLIAKNYGAPCSPNDVDCFRLSKVDFATLLVVLEEGEADVHFRPDFTVYRTADKLFRLPWSRFSADVDKAFALRQKGMLADDRIIAQYERMSCDYDYALEFAYQQLGTLAPSHLKEALRAAS